jgi:hypothetical protein
VSAPAAIEGDAADLSDLGVATGAAVRVDRRAPRPGGDLADGTVQHAGVACRHGELAVAGAEPGDERLDVTGGVGAHQYPPALAGVVTGVMAAAVIVGELRDRRVDHGELIGTRVCVGVPGPQDPRQRFAVIGEAERRMESEPALEMWRRALLGLRVDLDQ